MSESIRVEQIRDGSSRSEQTDLRGIIRLEQNEAKASGEKHCRSERSKNITDIEKSRAKREEKTVVRISDRRVIKVVRSGAEQAV